MLGLDPQSLRQFGLFGVIISEVLGTTLLFSGLGYWGFKNWGWPTWLSALLAIAGLVLAMIRVYFTVRREFKK